LPHDPDLDRGSGQGHISMHSTYRTTSILDHVTLASSNTKMWAFESHVISTFHKVWSHMIAYWEENSKIGLRQAVDEDSWYYHNQPSLLSFTPKWRRR